jgi:hypothetical protein
VVFGCFEVGLAVMAPSGYCAVFMFISVVENCFQVKVKGKVAPLLNELSTTT